mmetsp:Transcript_87450/g.245477  ORF Transcript_87450/g.245477 Transcript_87450/m.245477 type:complete len:235 (-) Transcript_87450:875-1579(-)
MVCSAPDNFSCSSSTFCSACFVAVLACVSSTWCCNSRWSRSASCDWSWSTTCWFVFDSSLKCAASSSSFSCREPDSLAARRCSREVVSTTASSCTTLCTFAANAPVSSFTSPRFSATTPSNSSMRACKSSVSAYNFLFSSSRLSASARIRMESWNIWTACAPSCKAEVSPMLGSTACMALICLSFAMRSRSSSDFSRRSISTSSDWAFPAFSVSPQMAPTPWPCLPGVNPAACI